ncbi:hypothetical protein Scep_009354 [Stephania cephalantha]|uniref:Uncharacterized protein n=1 Tax=Stephania cephalantha TaxID=152367 RepID=A0AAP0PCG3_9MAGN
MAIGLNLVLARGRKKKEEKGKRKRKRKQKARKEGGRGSCGGEMEEQEGEEKGERRDIGSGWEEGKNRDGP